MRGAFLEYLRLMWRHWWQTAIAVGFGIVGAVADTRVVETPIPTWTWYVLAFCSFAIAQYMSFATLHKEVTSYRAKPKADISLHMVFDRLYELARKSHMHNDAIELAINSIVEKQRPAIS